MYRAETSDDSSRAFFTLFMAFLKPEACRATLTELEGISWRVFAWTRESTSWMGFIMNLVEMTKWRSVVACFFHWSMISRPCLSAFDVIRVRATARVLNGAKKYGPHAEPCFFLQRSMRCETDPIEPGHVSIERPIFCISLCPAGRFASSRLGACGVSLASTGRP